MLTTFVLTKAKPREKPYKLSDGAGLHLLIQPNGSKLWRFRYRFDGKENMLTLGPFPAVALADAREKRTEAKKLLAQSVDPSQKRKEDKATAIAAAANTFGEIAEEYIEKCRLDGLAEVTLAKKRWLLVEIAAELFARPITEITPAEILTILKRLEKSGRRETAHRLRGIIGSVYRFAIATLKATADPTYALRGALAKVQVQHHAAIAGERELGALMVSVDEHDGWPVLRSALQFTVLTMSRPGEVRHMKRPEIDFGKAIWHVPADRMKMRRPHDVPLSRQAVAVLRDIWDASKEDGLVFPSLRSLVKPLSENAMNSALRRMGYTKDEVTAHGFRTSASTILNEREFNPDVIEACLSHQDPNEIRRTYNRSLYWKQRVELMQAWADLLDEFRNGLNVSRTAA